MQGAVRRPMAAAIGKCRNVADVRLSTRPEGLAGSPALFVAASRRAISPPSKWRLNGEQAGKPEALVMQTELP